MQVGRRNSVPVAGQVTVTVQAFCELRSPSAQQFHSPIAPQSNSSVWEKQPSHGDMAEAHSSPRTALGLTVDDKTRSRTI
jgi:hypothetical protein